MAGNPVDYVSVLYSVLYIILFNFPYSLMLEKKRKGPVYKTLYIAYLRLINVNIIN